MSIWNPRSFSARSPDDGLLTTVVGHGGTPYRCPDVPAVDAHIVRLYRRIGRAGPAVPAPAGEIWADIDLLLDRRAWLARVSADPPGPRRRARAGPDLIR